MPDTFYAQSAATTATSIAATPGACPADLGYLGWSASPVDASFGNASATYLSASFQASGNLAWVKVKNTHPGATGTGKILFAAFKGGTSYAGAYAGLYDNTGANVWTSSDFSADTSFTQETKTLGFTTFTAPFYYFVTLVATQGSTGGGVLYTNGAPSVVAGLSSTSAGGSNRWTGTISGQAYTTLPGTFSPTLTGNTNAIASPWCAIW